MNITLFYNGTIQTVNDCASFYKDSFINKIINDQLVILIMLWFHVTYTLSLFKEKKHWSIIVVNVLLDVLVLAYIITTFFDVRGLSV